MFPRIDKQEGDAFLVMQCVYELKCMTNMTVSITVVSLKVDLYSVAV